MNEKNETPLDRVIPYRGCTIFVTNEYRFIINVSEELAASVDTGGVADTLRDAKDVIDDLLEKQAKVEKAAAGIALKMRDAKGKEVIIKGLHARNGSLLPKQEQGVYPPEPWIMDDLAEIEKLESRVRALKAKVKPFALSSSPFGYRAADRQSYESLIAQLVETHADLCAKARAAAPKTEA